MADTLVQRVTGQASAGDVNVELQLMMPLDAMINPDDHSAAVIPGYGPLPGKLARQIVASSKDAMVAAAVHRAQRASRVLRSNRGRGSDPTLRRLARQALYGFATRPVAILFCDAPIWHIDHIRRHADGGSPHSQMAAASANAATRFGKRPGWNVTLIDCGFHGGPHTIYITTPTGHHYLSRAPDPP